MKASGALVLAGLLAAAATLGGCKPSQAPGGEPSGQANEAASTTTPDAKPGMSASEGRLILPVVPGRPGVAYFTVNNATTGNVVLASIHIDGVGKVEMHQTSGNSMVPVDRAEIGPGAKIAFEPGALHAMAFDIDPKLKPGGETEMTLTFADRDKLSVPIKVEAMGGADGMAGMRH
jgi:copper(I)-binding protein